MKIQSSFRLAGGLLIFASLLTIICFALLREGFQYPDILRMPAGYVLQHFQAAGIFLRVFWYGMTLGSLLLIPVALLLHTGLSAFRVRQATLITGLGVVAALFNTLGFMRWVFMVPALAATYTNPAASTATREASQVVFEAFHQYLGFSVGEHLGFMFLAGWGLSLAMALRSLPAFPAWFSWMGIASAVGTFLGVLEGAGWALAADIVAIGSSGLLLWMLLLGGVLLRVPLPAHQGLYRKVGESSFEYVS